MSGLTNSEEDPNHALVMMTVDVGPSSFDVRPDTSMQVVQRRELSFDHTQKFAFTHNQVRNLLDFNFGAGVLAVDHGVALLHAGRDTLAVVEQLAWSHGNNLALHRTFLGRLGQINARRGLVFRLNGFDENAIFKGFDGHWC